MPKFLLLLGSVKTHFLIIGTIWTFFQLYFLMRFDIVSEYEAAKYIEQAENLIKTGSYTSGNFLFYSTQILLIALCKKLQIGYWPIITIQIAANALSIWCFYGLVSFFTKSKIYALGFTIAFLAFIYYHLYNVYLFTESLYFSFSIIYTYVLFQTKKLSFKRILVLIFFVLFLYFSRPVGLFFLPATILFFVFKFYKKRALLISSLGAPFFILLYFLINNSLNSGGELDFLLPYLDERIICGVPTINQAHIIVNPYEKNSIEGLAYIISNHGNLFFRLAIKRLIAFFGVIRPYYSLPHNIFIAIYYYSIYCFILFGIRNMLTQWLPQLIFMSTIISFTVITVMLSCDEWHNRFILAILPFFLLLATAPFLQKEYIKPTHAEQ